MKNAHSVVSVDTSLILGKTVLGGPIILTLLYADSDPNVQYKYPFTVSVTFVPSANASLLATLLDNSSYNLIYFVWTSPMNVFAGIPGPEIYIPANTSDRLEKYVSPSPGTIQLSPSVTFACIVVSYHFNFNPTWE